MTGNDCSCKERELHFKEEKCSFVRQSDTNNLEKDKKEKYRNNKNSKLICKNGKIPFKQTNFAILFCA